MALNNLIAQNNSTLDLLFNDGRFTKAPKKKNIKEDTEYADMPTEEILSPEMYIQNQGVLPTTDINWNNVVLPQKSNLYLNLFTRINNFTNTDFTVYINSEEFNCHLIVLQCYSEVFQKITKQKVELPGDQCSPAAFSFIYEWMINGDSFYKNLSEDNVLEIYIAAKYLKIEDLIKQCWSFLQCKKVFFEETAYLMFMDAKEKNIKEISDMMLPNIQKFFFVLVSSEDWVNLDIDDVKVFLQSNYVYINCEIEIFMCAVRWLKYDWVNREEHKLTVMKCVRFANFAPWQLIDIKRNPDNKEFQGIVEDPEVSKMIDDGLAYVIIKYWGSNETKDLSNVLELKEPGNRNWSGLEKTYVTYREFLIYLNKYPKNYENLTKPAPKPKTINPNKYLRPGSSKDLN